MSSNHYLTHVKSNLNPKSTALVVVDMQYHDAHPDYGFCLGMEKLAPGSMVYYKERLRKITVPSIKSLISIFRTLDIPIIYLLLGSEYKDYRDMSERIRRWQLRFEDDCGIRCMLWKGSSLFNVIDELKPSVNDVSIMKRTYGGFASTNLESLLRSRGVESLVICGVTTGACPETTAREGFDRGFATVMVDDALCDTSEEHHNASLETFGSNFGDVLKNASDMSEALGLGRVYRHFSGMQATSRKPVV